MSNEKREAQKKNRENAIKRAQFAKSIKWIIFGALVLAVIGVGAYAIASNAVLNTKSVSNYSEGLNDDGTIVGVRALDYVELCDYKNITVNKSELEAKDEELQAQIDSLCSQYPTYDTDTSIKIKEGDVINLDYVGSIDDVPFDGGSTNGGGTLLTIGSHQYIDGFEDAIIGHNVGENFDIFVTFPENYGSADLAGKDAKFNITVNSVQRESEFTDAFVAEHFSEVATTAEGYKEYFRQAKYDQNLLVFVSDYIRNNSTVKNYPKDYLKIVKGQIKASDEETYAQYKMQFGDSYTFETYTGMTKKEYEASITNQAMQTLDDNLKMQALCEAEGLTVTEEDVMEFLDEYGLESQYYSAYESTYGKGYVYQAGMTYTAIKRVESLVNIVED